ncbi:MAG: sodium/proton-translocating pyrophosphatase [Acidimicrobiia bacterium]
MTEVALAAGGLVFIAVLTVIYFNGQIRASGTGELTGAAREVGFQVAEHLRRQIRLIAVPVALLGGALYWFTNRAFVEVVLFVAGVFAAVLIIWLSAVAASAVNVRLGEAARQGGAVRSMQLALRGGLVVGIGSGVILLVALLGGILAIDDSRRLAFGILGFSVVTLFTRIGNAVYNKAADIGADLAQASEPSVIADSAGDVLGGVVGATSDLGDSFVMSVFGALVLADFIIPETSWLGPVVLGVAACGLLGALPAIFVIRFGRDNPVAGFLVATLISVALIVGGGWWLLVTMAAPEVEKPVGLLLALAAGAAAAWGAGFVAEWFTSDHYKTVKEIARQSQIGPSTLVIGGIAAGMRAAALSTITLAACFVSAYLAGSWAWGDDGGRIGLVLGAIGAAVLLAIRASIGAFGPIADSGNGVLILNDQTDQLDSAIAGLNAVGNATTSSSRGYATATALGGALVMLLVFLEVSGLDAADLTRVPAFLGMILGIIFPFAFSALNLVAVGRSAAMVIDTVRVGGAGLGGLLDLVSGRARREMLSLGGVVLGLPVVLGLAHPETLGGFLVALVLVGFIQTTFFVNTGGVWSSANKLVEAGAFGGSGSDQHRATLVGDSAGDPLKDAVGPALSAAIKTMITIGAVMALVGLL